MELSPFYYRVHNSPSSFPILSHMNQVHNNKLRGLSPGVNYIDRESAICRRS
jgi:hypothetical protein